MKTHFRIFLLEDNPCIAEAIMDVLSIHAELSIQHLLTAESALELLSIQPPDLLILNVRLGGEMNGLEMSYRVRTRFKMPIILLTGESKRYLPQELFDLDALFLISKPFLRYQLLKVVNQALKNPF